MFIGSKGSWAQFVFICRNHFVEELYSTGDLYFATNLNFAVDLYSVADLRFAVDCFPCTSFSGPFLLFGLLCGFLGLDFYWAFGYGFTKMGINTYYQVKKNYLINKI